MCDAHHQIKQLKPPLIIIIIIITRYSSKGVNNPDIYRLSSSDTAQHSCIRSASRSDSSFSLLLSLVLSLSRSLTHRLYQQLMILMLKLITVEPQSHCLSVCAATANNESNPTL